MQKASNKEATRDGFAAYCVHHSPRAILCCWLISGLCFVLLVLRHSLRDSNTKVRATAVAAHSQLTAGLYAASICIALLPATYCS